MCDFHAYLDAGSFFRADDLSPLTRAPPFKFSSEKELLLSFETRWKPLCEKDGCILRGEALAKERRIC